MRERMDEIKAFPEALVVTLGLLTAFGRASADLERAALELFGRRATAVMTNVPGPREPLSIAGRPIERMVFWVPQSGRLGVGLSILSYAGAVSIGIAADAGLVPDPETIAAGFDREIEDLFALVGRRSERPRHRRAR